MFRVRARTYRGGWQVQLWLRVISHENLRLFLSILGAGFFKTASALTLCSGVNPSPTLNSIDFFSFGVRKFFSESTGFFSFCKMSLKNDIAVYGFANAFLMMASNKSPPSVPTSPPPIAASTILANGSLVSFVSTAVATLFLSTSHLF